MVRLIDADALKEGIKELKQSPWYNNDINSSWRQGIKDAVHVVEMLCIDEAPTIEAVPVVRCRECKAFDPDGAWREGFGFCDHHGHNMEEDGFCSWAVKKMDEVQE